MFKDEEGLAQLRTSPQLHCLEPAMLHTELNHSHIPSVPIAHRREGGGRQREGEVSWTGSHNGLSLQLHTHPSKAPYWII